MDNRLYIPKVHRRHMVDMTHKLAHPGVRNTIKQVSKVHKHTIAPIGTFQTPDTRFDHIHIAIVGPLPY
jgi:hypothetical protein